MTGIVNRRRFGVAALLVLLAVGVALLLVHARQQGSKDGALAKARLALVVPDFDHLSQDERAMLVGLARTCRLHERPAQTEAVVSCLREAARDPHALLPTGVERTTVPARLEQLLGHRLGA
ncbi:hypothetical protein [Cupriavidus sp. TMH.W2]|uniref:hypothetical protein n=1 Tax=Cupriavidus sp. TMH.W2 TaxID=3434465 RepID=UPI003D788B3B